MVKSQTINSLSLKQSEVFNVLHTSAKDYVKYDGQPVEPVHIFLSGNGGTGEYRLVKVVYNVISKTLLYHSEDPEKPTFIWACRNNINKYR